MNFILILAIFSGKCPFHSGQYVLKSLDSVEESFVEKSQPIKTDKNADKSGPPEGLYAFLFKQMASL